MSVSNTPMQIPTKAQDGILQFHKQCLMLTNRQWNIRESLERIDRAYMRESDFTEEHQRAKRANRYGDPNKFQNVTVPVVKPSVEAAVTYQTSVFLTGNPIFSCTSAPEFIDQAMQMNTIIDDQATRGAWSAEFIKFFRDLFKYNIGAVEISWADEVTAALETDVSYSTKLGKPKEVVWSGNKLKRMDLYNSFWDTRVPATEHYKKGEFFGYTELKSRMELKAFINSLPDKIVANVVPAFESGLGTAGLGVNGIGAAGLRSFYVPQLNQDALVSPISKGEINWLAWAGVTGADTSKIQYKNVYEVTTLYGRIIPSDFGIKVPSPNTPQVWKFIIVNHSVIIYAERQTNAHGYIPVLFGQPYDDGLWYQTKSLADDVVPMQELSTALANSVIASRRRALSDRVLYDPSRVDSAHINNPNPSAKIPVRPAAYGKAVSEAVYQFPFRDDQASIALSEVQLIQQFAYELTGQNKAKQGQFVKGNKTLHEYESVMSHANGFDQRTAILLEGQVFTPLKEILKINILQYQGGTQLFNKDTEEVVRVDPVALRKAVLNFKVSDGLIPADKLINGDDWTVAMQVIGSSPQIGANYNLGGMFSYLMKTKGADLRAFEKSPQQLAYEQALQTWTAMKQLSIEKGVEFKDPQPKPADYGYEPRKQMAGAVSSQSAEVATKVNNITNNITNSGE